MTEISARSRRDLGEFFKSRRESRRDLGEILKSRRPKTRRDSCRDLKISSRFSPRSQRDLKISAAKNSPRISTRLNEISKSGRPKPRRESRQDVKYIVRSRRDIKILEAKKISPRKLEVFLAMFPRYFKMSILRFRKAFHKFVD